MSESAGRHSAEQIRSAVADWVEGGIGWKDYRMELQRGNAEGEASGWLAIVYRFPETPGDHAAISLDASGRILSTHQGR